MSEPRRVLCPCNRCGTFGDRVMTFGCMGEHIDARAVCEAGERLGRTRAIWCDRCREAGFPHRPMKIIHVRLLERT